MLRKSQVATYNIRKKKCFCPDFVSTWKSFDSTFSKLNQTRFEFQPKLTSFKRIRKRMGWSVKTPCLYVRKSRIWCCRTTHLGLAHEIGGVPPKVEGILPYPREESAYQYIPYANCLLSIFHIQFWCFIALAGRLWLTGRSGLLDGLTATLQKAATAGLDN